MSRTIDDSRFKGTDAVHNCKITTVVVYIYNNSAQKQKFSDDEFYEVCSGHGGYYYCE